MRVLTALQAGLVLIILLGGVYLSATTLAPQKRADCSGCNVILISIDTLGAKHTSVYDPSLDTTPFLKELGARGAVFDAAYSQAPWTLPSHVAMFTGKYPWNLNIWLSSDILRQGSSTVASVLATQGYDTVGFSNGAFVRPAWGLDAGFNEFYGSVQEDAWEDVPQIFMDATAWLKKHPGEKPFFMLIRPFEVHDPYTENGVDIRVHEISSTNLSPDANLGEAAARFRDAYRAEVRKTDAALRDFFTSLTSLGLDKNTIVIITADHGEEFNEHGTAAFHAVTTYREVLRVPLIVVTPLALTPRRVPSSVEIRSIPATLYDLLELPPNYTIAPSLVPYLEGIGLGHQLVESRTALERNSLLSYFANGYGATGLMPKDRFMPYNGPYTQSFIKGDTHVIQNPDGTREAYQMGTDPEESQSLINGSENADLPSDVEELLSLFK